MMSYFEIPQSGSCDKPHWTHSVATPYLCPNAIGVVSEGTWQGSGRYVQVCSETDADLVSYHFTISGDHSAVKEIVNGQTKYISKYNYNGPLVEHNLHTSFYELRGEGSGSPQFWSYVGFINGNHTITGTNPVSFNVNNIATVNYSWTVLSGYDHIYISSGAYQSNVTLVPTHSGQAVLKLNVSSSCGSVRSQQITLNITTNICLEGIYDNNGIYNQNLNTTNNVSTGGVYITVTCPNSTTVIWQKTSGNINGYFPPGYTNSFNMTSGGSISFLLTAKNGSTTISTRNVSFYNYGYFTVYPNPSSETITIDANPEIDFSVLIESLDGETKMELQDYFGGDAIDVSSLQPGNYSIKIYDGKQLINQQRIYIEGK